MAISRGAATTPARRLVGSTSPATPGAPAGVTTTLAYDRDGRLSQAQQSANGVVLQSVATSYTPSGQRATTTDAKGNVTRFVYDPVDRLASVTDPVGRTTSYAYDAVSRRIQTLNTAIQSAPLLQQAYTPDGLLASFTVARNNTTFATTSLAYDALDRLSTTTYPIGSTEVLTYDADGNVLSRQTRAGPTITFTYDTLNRLKTKAPPSEPTVTYAYDLKGQLIGVGDNSAAIISPVPPSGGALSVNTTYDALNRPLTFSWSPAVTPATSPTASNSTFNYGYNQANQRISQYATDNSWWSYPAATASTVSYTANSLDQYTAVGAVTPTYDNNGNLTFDGTFTYGYDVENRLISASQGGTTVATYAYDALGSRKSKTLGSTTTITLIGTDKRAMLDYDGTSGQIQRWYAFGAGPNDVLNQMNLAAGTRTTFVPDILGSMLASLDSGSGVLTKAGYQPYGESSSTSGTFRYTSARIDAETNGLYDFRARMYSPVLGRFLQADPIGASGGVNLYAYVNNDPLNSVDLSGLVQQLGGGGTVDQTAMGASPLTTLSDSSGAPTNQNSLMGLGNGGPSGLFSNPISPSATQLDNLSAGSVDVPSAGLSSSPVTSITTSAVAPSHLALPQQNGGSAIQLVGDMSSELETLGGGPPRFQPTPKGAAQFIFPNGMILRFDLLPGQYLPGQGPHINLETPGGGNLHIPLGQ